MHLDHAADEAGWARLVEAIDDIRAWHALRNLRVGLLGAPSDWLVASMPSDEAIRASWGATAVALPIDALHAKLDQAGPPAETAATRELASRAAASRDVSQPALLDALRVVAAVDEIVAEHRLGAVAVRCFDLVTTRKTTGCLALALLNDRGVTAGCEGDLASTVGMAWARALFDQPSWMANPAGVDEAENTLLLAHCTVPLGMVESYGVRTHFESGLGVALAGRFAIGPVTLLRLGRRRLERLWVADADLVATGADEDLCRTQVRVRLRDASVAELLRRPLGNHLVLVQGHHGARLRSWWDAWGPG